MFDTCKMMFRLCDCSTLSKDKMNDLVELILFHDIQSLEDHELKLVEFGIFCLKRFKCSIIEEIEWRKRQIVRF